MITRSEALQQTMIQQREWLEYWEKRLPGFKEGFRKGFAFGFEFQLDLSEERNARP